jgi:hypothetical protein
LKLLEAVVVFEKTSEFIRIGKQLIILPHYLKFSDYFILGFGLEIPL